MTDVDLEGLSQLERDATPGPWRRTHGPDIERIVADYPGNLWRVTDGLGCKHEDETLILAMRNALPKLLEIARERDALRQQIADHRCGLPSSIIDALNSGDGTYRP